MLPPPSFSPGSLYLVGGAVRDQILGLGTQDRDYVIVGQTPESLAALGFRPVGKDFPVFLHPDTQEEYALARTERKTGPGYHGFAFSTDASVTIEDDLFRRDLTINAMALDDQGRLVDPYGGMRDLEDRWLRHVSPAFAEDPVRILRVARFAARYAHLGFRVAPETLQLMKDMVAAGEVAHLVPERVWAEFEKACACPRPSVYLQVLRACGALAVLAPEVDALYGVDQVALYHPEIDTGVHTEMVLDQAVRLAPGDTAVAFAALTHDLGKALTPTDIQPKHPGHEEAGLVPLAQLAQRWKVPSETRVLANAVCRHHLDLHRLFEVRPGTVLTLLEATGALKHPVRFERFVHACEADKRGRLGRTEDPYPQADHLRALRVAALGVSAAPFVAQGKQGIEVGEAVREARLKAIHAVHAPLRRAHKAPPPAPTPPGRPRP